MYYVVGMVELNASSHFVEPITVVELSLYYSGIMDGTSENIAKRAKKRITL